ncbi:rcc01693 family protein [Chelatococcus sp. GCM10030263]|uniref:rcc01693 family protein n=1 Tax=Chelatococcus sp. GCM10030263 TaxID=3273387 RepID=UPI003611D4D6
MTAAGRFEPPPFPWAEVMAFGLGVLRLNPREFWGMTTRELAAAIDGASGRRARVAPMTRADLAALMHAFPDQSGDCQ